MLVAPLSSGCRHCTQHIEMLTQCPHFPGVALGHAERPKIVAEPQCQPAGRPPLMRKESSSHRARPHTNMSLSCDVFQSPTCKLVLLFG